MYLKNIKINGFKSFADKTDISFNKNITAIVGPNGSGKSNIIDAVKWVLGEQSLKSLRASNLMSDVIFKGSKNRKGLNKASVALLFDNSNNFLNTEFNEVEIKREIYKSGESDYYINNTKVRLKDIQNLFLDKGVGSKAFNIISQGNISDVVNARAIDRRSVIEQAAGVLKYKQRKDESLKKLDRTKTNINSIKLLTNELYTTLRPLKRQQNAAIKYNSYKNELENIEIGLISKDITEYDAKLNSLKSSLDGLNSLLEKYNFQTSDQIEKLKTNNLLSEEQISKLDEELNLIEVKLYQLAKEKGIYEEKIKFNLSEEQINKDTINLKEEEAQLNKKINILKESIKITKESLKKNIVELNNLNDKILERKLKNTNYLNNIESYQKDILILKNKIEITKNNIANQEGVPFSVKNIVNNSSLNTHGTIGSLISYDSKYDTALDTALGYASNFIIVDNFNDAKKCINYLKEHKLGKATFFPLDTIKSRYVNETFNNLEGFISIASDVVQYNSKYQNIIENQLGNILIVKDIDSLNKIAKYFNYRYKIVSLDGEVSFPGGSVQGGTASKVFNYKSILEKEKKELEHYQKKYDDLNKIYTSNNEKYLSFNEQAEKLVRKNYLIEDDLKNKEREMLELAQEREKVVNDIENNSSLSLNKGEERLVNLINELQSYEVKKAKINNQLNELKDNRFNNQNLINSLEKEEKQTNQKIYQLKDEINQKELKKQEIEIKLDNLLIRLSEEYNLTYEATKDKYFLELEEALAREKVKELRTNINKLGHINLDSIDEFERINTRYEFLKKQEEDLIESSKNLKSIIEDMDQIMSEKFITTFDLINKEYKLMFKNMFQGGKGELVLTDPNDILNTGVELIAEPPGKKLGSTVALSGGEKSLAAICLLFSVLNVFPVPFIILDEAEAALDEANVDLFGKYISKKKELSQFILITHKKRMMEYADVLYGITMQESGVSKIVSTKLK